MWAAFTILTTRAYLNLCKAALVRQPGALSATVMTVLSHNHTYSQSQPQLSYHHQMQGEEPSLPAYHSPTDPSVLQTLRKL